MARSAACGNGTHHSRDVGGVTPAARPSEGARRRQTVRADVARLTTEETRTVAALLPALSPRAERATPGGGEEADGGGGPRRHGPPPHRSHGRHASLSAARPLRPGRAVSATRPFSATTPRRRHTLTPSPAPSSRWRFTIHEDLFSPETQTSSTSSPRRQELISG